MSSTIEQDKRDYGHVVYDGVSYVLTQQAYLENDSTGTAIYQALAQREDQWVADPDPVEHELYMVEWDITDPDCDDESHACDWDNPADVRKL